MLISPTLPTLPNIANPNTYGVLAPTLPTFTDITSAFSGLMVPSFPSIPAMPSFPSFPNISAVPKLPPIPSLPSLPSLPTFPKPFFGPVDIPSVIVPHWTVELQNTFYGGMIVDVLKYICAPLGLNWASLIPAIPSLPGITIMDFIDGNISKIENAIKKAGTAFTSLFPTPLFPGVPAMPGITHAPMEMLHMIQMTFTNQIKAVVDIVISKIGSIINLISNAFQVGLPFPTFPTFPSLASITAMITSVVPVIPKITGIPSITFPGFPPITIPSFDKIHAPTMQAVKSLPMVTMDLIIGMLKPVVSFVNEIAQFFGQFPWPKLGVNVNGFYVA